MNSTDKKLAIVIELQGEMEKSARTAWNVLDAELSIKYISSRSPGPHIALETNFQGNHQSIFDALKGLSRKVPSFSLQGFGLGVFIAETPVVHIRWLINREFLTFKSALVQTLQNLEKQKEIAGYQVDENWQAKTTLAYKDSSFENLPRIIEALRPLDFRKGMVVGGIGLYEYSVKEAEKKLTFCSFKT